MPFKSGSLGIGVLSMKHIRFPRSIHQGEALSSMELLQCWQLALNSYLGQYSLILAAIIVVYAAWHIFYIYGTLRASRRIGASLVDSVLGATLRWVQRKQNYLFEGLTLSHRWLDKTPTGRIIARCTQDIRAVDGPIPEAFLDLTELGITMLTKVVVILMFTPIFLLPSIAVAALGYYLGNLYIRAQLSVKRERRYENCDYRLMYRSHMLFSNARSPLLAHFSAAIAGIGNVHLLVDLTCY